MLDGATANRSFTAMLVESNHNPMGPNIVDTASINPIIFIQDPSHVLKKIRNSILNRGDGLGKTRKLKLNGSMITWDLWVTAYIWDQKHSFPIHEKLTDSHLFPPTQTKFE